MRCSSALLALLLAGLAVIAPRWRHAAEPPKFVQVAPGLYSITQWWVMAPGLPAVPVSQWLVNEGDSWLLVDTGPPGRRYPHPQQLLSALHAVLPPGQYLKAIALTHAHVDHVGGLPLLLDAFPSTPVIIHALERDYLVGNASYWSPASTPELAERWWHGGRITVPEARVVALEESLGDLEAYGAENLLYVLTPGHSPGHTAFLHYPSSTVLAGDALLRVIPSLQLLPSNTTTASTSGSTSSSASSGSSTAGRLAQHDGGHELLALKPFSRLPGVQLAAKPHILCQPPSCNLTDSRRSACLLAHGLMYDRMLLAHDVAPLIPGAATAPSDGGGPSSSGGDSDGSSSGGLVSGGLSQEQVKQFVSASFNCKQFEDDGAEDGDGGEADDGAGYEVAEEEEDDEYE